jgi:hypothetical protein
VIGQALQELAEGCKSRIPKKVYLPCLALCCARGGIGVVFLSVCTLRDKRQVLVNLACHDELLIAYLEEQTKEGTTFVG